MRGEVDCESQSSSGSESELLTLPPPGKLGICSGLITIQSSEIAGSGGRGIKIFGGIDGILNGSEKNSGGYGGSLILQRPIASSPAGSPGVENEVGTFGG